VKNLNILFCLLCVLLFVGCQDQESNDEIINIEEEFNIEITEQLGELERSLIFNVTTIDAFDCLNYKIDCSCVQAPSIATLYIEEIIEPAECLTGIATANCQSVLENLQLGETPFRIVIKEAVINNGTITKTATDYSIDLETKHGIGTYRNELKVIPDNMIWVSVTSDNQEQSIGLNATLEAYLSTHIVPQLNNGYYGYFTIIDKELHFQETKGTHYVNTYYFELEGEKLLENLKEVADVLRSEFTEVDLDLYTSEGIKF